MDGPYLSQGGTVPGGLGRSFSGITLLLTLSVLSTGCAHVGGTSAKEWIHNKFKVGPNYRTPATAVNPDWVNGHPSGEPCPCCKPDPDNPGQFICLCSSTEVPTFDRNYVECSLWWNEAFYDETGMLDELIATAFQQNLTIQEAAFRVLEARALRGIAIGGLFPQTQTANGSYTRRQLPGNNTLDVWNLGFALAWELDVWGRLRRQIEIADANLDASIENYDFVVLSRVADVAATYVEIRTLQERIEIACQNLAIQQAAVKSARALRGPDPAVEIGVVQAETNALQTEASIPPLQASLAQAFNRLSVLMGIPPQDLSNQLGNPARLDRQRNKDSTKSFIPRPASDVVRVGMPNDLLRRRPDVRAAERAVAAQSAKVGVAVAELYPAFSLSGTINWTADNLGDVFRTNSFNGNVTPAFRWKILNYGRLRNAIAGNEAALGRLAVVYQNTVLNAQLEAENALAGYSRQYQTVQLLSDAAQKARDTVDDVARFRETDRVNAAEFGSNFTFVSLSTRLANENALALARQSLAVNLINLYRAIGGGWEIRFDPSYRAPTRFSIGSRHGDMIEAQEVVPVEIVPQGVEEADQVVPALPENIE